MNYEKLKWFSLLVLAILIILTSLILDNINLRNANTRLRGNIKNLDETIFVQDSLIRYVDGIFFPQNSDSTLDIGKYTKLLQKIDSLERENY